MNAAIAPVVSTYLGRVETKLADLGIRVPLCVMQSNGGMCTFEIARRKPVQIVESGPAAGVTVAAHIGLLDRSPPRHLARHRRHDRQGRA